MFTLYVHAWGKLTRLCVLVDVIFSLFLSSGAFVKRATHLYFRNQKLKIGMGLILRLLARVGFL